MDLITKAFHEVKFSGMDGSGPGEFSGYASVAGVLDSGGDIVEHGAFLAGLPEFIHDGFIGLDHEWKGRFNIATVADAHEDEHGLFIKAEYHSTDIAQEARKVAMERMARGKSVGLSIGFKINPGGADVDEEGHRRLKSIKLYEVSHVAVPMNRDSNMTEIKGFGITFEDHSEHVRVAVQEWLERALSGSDVRLKEGRAISTARMTSMAKMRDALHGHANEIDAMLAEVTPKPKAEDQPEDFSGLYAAFLLTQARLNGLPILN